MKYTHSQSGFQPLIKLLEVYKSVTVISFVVAACFGVQITYGDVDISVLVVFYDVQK